MSTTARSERITQNRVAKLFSEALGYTHLGEWSKRENNRNIERGMLEANLAKRGYTPEQISAAIQKLTTAADATGITLYQANLRTYQLLRYGVQVQTAIGADHVTFISSIGNTRKTTIFNSPKKSPCAAATNAARMSCSSSMASPSS